MEGLAAIVFLGFLLYVLVKAANRSRSRKRVTEDRAQSESLRASSGPSLRVTVNTSVGTDGRRREVDPDRVWVPPDRPISVGGCTIPGGMLYVGDYLQSAGGSVDPEPALITPRLKVDRTRPNTSGTGMGYWPSYSTIDATSRAAYLEWLSAGRCDPDAYIGYVFLYFYGLERRALADAATSTAAQGEIGTIRREVERLLSIYGDNGSFRRYAADFLDFLHLLHAPSRFYEQNPPLERNGYELPISVRLALGQLAVEGKPIPPDWAAAWVMLHPEARLRTPAKRCPNEFRRLFKIRYSGKYGHGLRVAPNKRNITCEYRPASASFPQSLRAPFGDLPDVSVLSRPLNSLMEVADECANELEPFSRFMGRAGADRQALAAFALLPAALGGIAESGEASRLQDWIEGCSGEGDTFEVPAAGLICQWPGAEGDKLATKEATLLVQLLEKLGYGLEPDPRFGGPALKSGEKAVVFRVTPDSPRTPSPQYKASTALVHVGVTVASADGKVAEAEREYLLSHVNSVMHLSVDEQRRLRAHLLWLIGSPAGFAGLKRRLETLSPKEKQALVDFSIGVVGADGRVEPGEVKALTKIYTMLGFPADDVYAHIHAVMAAPASASEGPVTVQVAGGRAPGFAVPPSEEVRRKVDGGVSLDMRAVRAKIEETAEVSRLLSTIFIDESSTSMPSQDAGTRIGPLDAVHSQLLRAIVRKGQMSRDEYEEAATSLGLLPDGALDAINDAAFELCDRPVCEGDDPICVDVEVAKEIAA